MCIVQYSFHDLKIISTVTILNKATYLFLFQGKLNFKLNLQFIKNQSFIYR